MSWQTLARETIREENPQLHQKLIQEGELVAHAADYARSMTEQCRLMAPPGTDEATKAQVREVVIAEMREVIRAEQIGETECRDAPADLSDLTGWRWG